MNIAPLVRKCIHLYRASCIASQRENYDLSMHYRSRYELEIMRIAIVCTVFQILPNEIVVQGLDTEIYQVRAGIRDAMNRITVDVHISG